MGALCGTKMTDTPQQQKNTYNPLSNLHECLICNSKVTKSECVKLKNCQHSICHDCLNKSINPNLKNINKYPLQCPKEDCDKPLDSDDLKDTLNDKQIQLFNNLNRCCSLPPKEREHCPKCEMWFKYFPKWQRTQSQPFEYIKDEDRTECKECKIKFQRAVVKRHRCRICGECYCDDCSSTKVPLSATPNQIISLWKHNRGSSDLQKGKQWLKGLAATSTLKNVFPEDDTKQLTHTESERVGIEHERVRCCYDCWLDYYCVKCKECKYKYCIHCRNEWHDNFDCEQQRKTSVQLTEISENKQNNVSVQNNRNKVTIGASKSAGNAVESNQAMNTASQALSKAEERGKQLKQLDVKAQHINDAATQFEALTREMARKTI